MRQRRSAHRSDANHAAIRDAFRKLGCTTLDLNMVGNGCGDLLVGYGGLCILAEIKATEKSKLTPKEEAFHKSWTGGMRIVRNLDHVLETVNVLKGWQAAIFANLAGG